MGQRAMGMQIAWGKNLWWKAMEWYTWGAFYPAIVWFCQRLGPTPSRWRLVGGHLAAGAGFAALHCIVLTTGARIEAEAKGTGNSWLTLFNIVFSNHFHEDVLTYVAVASVWYALDHYRRLRERELQAVELEAHLVKSHLRALTMQLQPHFLFNTLNGIAALNHEDPRAANRMLVRLSDLLRMTLEDARTQEVPLRRELDFNRCYLELEQIRLGRRLTVAWDTAAETLEARVPSLLLQPLIENAVRHGIAPFSANGTIGVLARRDKDTLLLQVADSGPGLPGGETSFPETGVGLKNTRERLRQLYGDNQTLSLRRADGVGLLAEIRLPFHLTDTSPGLAQGAS